MAIEQYGEFVDSGDVEDAINARIARHAKWVANDRTAYLIIKELEALKRDLGIDDSDGTAPSAASVSTFETASRIPAGATRSSRPSQQR